MKKLSKMLVKGVFVITLFTGISVTLSTNGIKSVNEAHASASYQQVYSYLSTNGYTVVSLDPIVNLRTEDWTAHTVINSVDYTTQIHVKNSSIIGHEDVIL